MNVSPSSRDPVPCNIFLLKKNKNSREGAEMAQVMAANINFKNSASPRLTPSFLQKRLVKA